jgi:hypothetical protein
MGFALPSLLPRQYTHYAAAGLFVFFGFKLLKVGLLLRVCPLIPSGSGSERAPAR